MLSPEVHLKAKERLKSRKDSVSNSFKSLWLRNLQKAL